MTDLHECLDLRRPGPMPMAIFSDLVIQIETSVSQPIRSENDDLMSGWVLHLMLDITTPPLLYVCCFWIICLDTGVQPQLDLPCVWILPLGPGVLGGASQGLYCLVEVSPFCPAPINSPEPSMMLGEAGWTVRGTPLHHALGTSQVWASGPDSGLVKGLGSDRISGALGAHLDHPEPGLPKGLG